MTEKIISLAIPETQEAIIKTSASPVNALQLGEQLYDQGFELNHLLEVNVYWLLKSGELTARNGFFLSSGNNPHQLTLPDFDDYQKTA